MILPVFLSTLKHISFRAIGYGINLIRNLVRRELDVIYEADFFSFFVSCSLYFSLLGLDLYAKIANIRKSTCKKHNYMVRYFMRGRKWKAKKGCVPPVH